MITVGLRAIPRHDRVMAASAVPIFAPGTPPVPCTAGVSIVDALRELEELVGQDVVAAARASLNSDQRAEIDALTAVSWVRMSTSAALFDAAARLAGCDAETMVDDIVRRASKRTYSTVWRMLLRLTSADAMLKRCSAVYMRSRNVGQLSARIVEPGLAELILAGWPDAPQRQVRIIGISVAIAVTMSGRRDVRFEFDKRPDGARYELRWNE
jgi:hypothetical protein